jgi:recombination protein RecR
MGAYPKAVEEAIERLKMMPGIGEKSAHRIAFFLLKKPAEEVLALAGALRGLKEDVVACGTCGNIAGADPCDLCADPARDGRTLCVVEEPNDVVVVESTGRYRGRYHVLLGALSPMRGVGPEDLRIQELADRVEREEIDEVILAMNANADGEATAAYLARILKPTGVRVTRIAQGLPVGGVLEFVDQVTMTRAMEGRREM